MKKTVVLMVMVAAAVMAAAAPVDAQRARQVAQNAARLYSWALSSDAKNGLNPYADCELTEVSEARWGGDLYVFNYAMPADGREGFVVVSGDDVAEPVLAFSDEGAFEPNPAVFFHLGQYSRQIAQAQRQMAVASKALQGRWDRLASGEALYEAVKRQEEKGDLYNDDIKRLLGGMRWGQGRPYNNKCPGRSVTGCVATAFGMLMNYWDYPVHGFGRHSYNGADNPAAYGEWPWGTQFVDYENAYYDWANMADVVMINSDEAAIEAVSTLLYHVGVALDMRYGESASGSWSLPEYAIYDTSLHLDPSMGADTRIPRHFGYKFSYAGMRDSVHSDSLWMLMLYQSLADSMPIYYAGWAKDGSEDGHSGTQGHGYVIDGYFSDAIDSNMFHINWGWSGSSDGYFKLDAMKPGTSDFTQWHGAVIGLQPDTSYHGYDWTGIRAESPVAATIVGLEGRIVVKGCEGKTVEVYDLMGRLVGSRLRNEGTEWTLRIKRGIYVVRLDGHKGQKVAVF